MSTLVKINTCRLFVAVLFLLGACKKDPGNYNYQTINEAVVTGLAPLYVIDMGERPNISPQISYTKDATGDTVNYRYQWLLTGKDGGDEYTPKVLDSDKVFDTPVNLLTGVYNMLYRITDKRTGVWKEYPFQLLVAVKTYEGWLLLSEIPGQKSRLDMISYQPKTGNFLPIIDVLSTMKSAFKLTGAPNFVCYGLLPFGPATDDSDGKLIVSTTGEAAFLGIDTLDYGGFFNNVSIYMSGTERATDAGAKLEITANSLFGYLTVKNSIYYAGQAAANRRFTKVNKLKTTSTFFKASPYVSFDYLNTVAFDEDNSRFVWCNQNEYDFSLFGSPELNNLNRTVLFMCRTTYNGDETFAILKNKTDSRVFLYRLTSRALNSVQEITGTSLAQAEQIAVNSEFGYIFYNAGGKIYEYDFSLGLNKEMADYGTKKISLLKFQNVAVGSTGNETRYANMRKQLIVCTYDDANLSTSGIMDVYNVPGINGQILKTNSFSGLGKVISITYRSR